MGKVAKPKHDPLKNPRSRAAKRATSPSIDVDKSVKETGRPTDMPPILGPIRNAGIHKKKKVKFMSKGQRERREKGLARAEAVQDQQESKIAEAKTRHKRRQARKSLWEDINTTSKDEARKAIKGPGRFEALKDENDEWEDQQDIQPFHGDTEIKVINGVQVPSFAAGTSMIIAGRPGPAVGATSKVEKPEPDEIT